jgi:hypothetical protein
MILRILSIFVVGHPESQPHMALMSDWLQWRIADVWVSDAEYGISFMMSRIHPVDGHQVMV